MICSHDAAVAWSQAPLGRQHEVGGLRKADGQVAGTAGAYGGEEYTHVIGSLYDVTQLGHSTCAPRETS